MLKGSWKIVVVNPRTHGAVIIETSKLIKWGAYVLVLTSEHKIVLLFSLKWTIDFYYERGGCLPYGTYNSTVTR
jgi:hypothetical protein